MIAEIPRRVLTGGLEVSVVGVGCWAIGGPGTNLGLPMGWSTADDDRSLAGLRAAYALGANLFDTADVYGHGHSERLLGRFLAEVPRENVVLSSKVGYFAGTAVHGYDPSHMRHQLETTLNNLGTSHLDVYFLHNSNFGPDDHYLPGAITQMKAFQDEGLIGCVGMRGPHRFATERLTTAPSGREDKHTRFLRHFRAIKPSYLAVRFNALTPAQRGGQNVFTFAADHGASILINKPLGQGLLTGKHTPHRPPAYGPGDHRLRKAWFTPAALDAIDQGLQPLRDHFGPDRADLVRAALGYAIQHADNSAVLIGYTTPEQITQNLAAAAAEPLTPAELDLVRITGTHLQERLDALGEVFTDEKTDI